MTIEQTPGPTNPVWVLRTGPKTFSGHNPRGASVQLAAFGVEGEYFTPGELLKVALAGCTAVTSEAPLVRALGEDYDLEIRAAGASEDNRYPALLEELLVDLSSMDDAARERVLTVLERAIDKHCTVGRTVSAGARVDLTIAPDVDLATAPSEPDTDADAETMTIAAPDAPAEPATSDAEPTSEEPR